MEKITIYSIVAVLAFGLVAGLFFWISLPSSEGPVPSTQPSASTGGTSGTTQVGSDSTDSTITSATPATLAVVATLGNRIIVSDFTKDPQTITSSYIPGHYFISGGVDAYFYDSPYSVYYVVKDESFSVDLLKEPIGGNRKLAEQELMQKLGISQIDMCRLRYFVSVQEDVNEFYAAKGNLGFSFCPGATFIP